MSSSLPINQRSEVPATAQVRTPTLQVARFAVTSLALPRLIETLRVAETFRYCLMGLYGRQMMRDGIKGSSPVFSGKNADGSRRLTHGHCQYLPTSENQEGNIDHLTLFAADGFDTAERRAIESLHLLKPRHGDTSIPPMDLELIGLGSASELHSGPLQLSRRWISTTPFLASDHPKTRGRWRDTERGGGDPVRFLESQMRKELVRWLDRRGIDLPLERIDVGLILDESGISRRPGSAGGDLREPVTAFRRSRWKHEDDGSRRLAGFFRIEFPREVPGPLSLGYSSHFGMGLFHPSRD
jgi:CRISPR-associated protein Csb2